MVKPYRPESKKHACVVSAGIVRKAGKMVGTDIP